MIAPREAGRGMPRKTLLERVAAIRRRREWLILIGLSIATLLLAGAVVAVIR